MKKNKEFMKKMIWLLAGFFACVHFLTAQVGAVENVQHIITNVKVDLEEYISGSTLWKSTISILYP